MKAKQDKQEKRKGAPLFLSIMMVFCILGTVVYTVSREITREMSASAIQNLSESLDLLQCTIEAILRSEAEFQTLIAREVGRAEDPEDYILAYERNQTMAKLSLILSRKTEGISSTGEPFTEEGLDFSAGGTVMGLPVSQSYLNFMGTWSYTIKCPVQRDGRQIGTLYAEYVYDAVDESLPDGFYNRQASVYIMDAASERFVLKPKGMGQRSAGHLNLADYYRANDIQDSEIRAEVDACLKEGKNLLFYHDIRDVNALNYMWPVNGGTIFLVGYVPVQAIQQEGRTVNQNIYIVVGSMLAAFFLCLLLYSLNGRQQDKLREERVEERRLPSP
ncbi:MAG: hybrid sensor histidine kinase/response regulator, partial [Dysosmobacter sp.]|nr:hybrid sensor histidine kinase/response regulator [Dysosmobacter sp.]